MKKKILALGLCCALIFSGCSLSSEEIQDAVNAGIEAAQDQAAKTEETEAPQETEGPKETEISLGKKVTLLDDWKITVKKMEAKKSINKGGGFVFPADKGQIYICVTMTIRNNGKEAAKLLPRVGMRDTMCTATLFYDDYEYKGTSLIGYDKDLMDTTIQPLTGKTGIIAFQVPKKVAKQKKKLKLRIGSINEAVICPLAK